MTLTRTHTTARCTHPGCSWSDTQTATHDGPAVDRASQRHTTQAGHPTTTTSVPTKEEQP